MLVCSELHSAASRVPSLLGQDPRTLSWREGGLMEPSGHPLQSRPLHNTRRLAGCVVSLSGSGAPMLHLCTKGKRNACQPQVGVSGLVLPIQAGAGRERNLRGVLLTISVVLPSRTTGVSGAQARSGLTKAGRTGPRQKRNTRDINRPELLKTLKIPQAVATHRRRHILPTTDAALPCTIHQKAHHPAACNSWRARVQNGQRRSRPTNVFANTRRPRRKSLNDRGPRSTASIGRWVMAET